MAANFINKTLKRHFKKLKSSPSFVIGIAIGAGLKELIDEWLQEKPRRSVNARDVTDSPYMGFIPKISVVGEPVDAKTLYYSNYLVKYNNNKKIPHYVLEYITKDKLNGDADRRNCSFMQDLNIPHKFRSTNEDYMYSGFDRGHMVPAGNVKNDQRGMAETFYLSNVVPQNSNNNAGFWYRLEAYCRALARRYNGVYVFSGPLFLPETELDGRKFVKYQLIGENEVAVPTHLFKIIVVERDRVPYAYGAFIVPNTDIDDNKVLKDFQVALEDIEKYSGFEFLRNIRSYYLEDLCVYDGCKMISQEMADLYTLHRIIQNAKSIDQLNEIWQQVQKENIQVDRKVIDGFLKKKAEFKSERS